MEADHLGAQMRQDDSCLAVFLIDGARAPPSDIRAILRYPWFYYFGMLRPVTIYVGFGTLDLGFRSTGIEVSREKMNQDQITSIL